MIDPDTRSRLDALDARSEEWVALLTRWSAINSGSDHAAGLARMVEALADAFGGLPDVQCERVPLGENAPAPALRVRCRPEAPRQVLLNGHYDTVFAADHPFQHALRTDAHTLTGPGVADMKGGLVALFAALSAFETHPARHGLGWELLLTPDEEIGSPFSRELLCATARRHTLALVFETCPDGDDIVRTRKGTGEINLVAHGRAAHSSRLRTEGRNAIVGLASLVETAHALNTRLLGASVNVATFHGGGQSTQVPDHATAHLHLRLTCHQDFDTICTALRERADELTRDTDVRFTIEGRVNRPPKPVSAAEDAWFAVLQDCGRQLGQTIGRRDVNGASDGAFFASLGVPTLDGLGVDGDDLHTDREFCRLPSLTRRARLTALFLLRIATGSGLPSFSA